MVMQNLVDRHEEFSWNPITVIERPSHYKYAVVILNQPIKLSKSILLPLWKEALVTVTVDGGTDRWMKYLDGLSLNVYNGKSAVYVPTLITGDMDSIKIETREKLEKVGSKVICTPDQTYTDHTKALIELSNYCQSHCLKLDGIYVISETYGRLDHIIGNINTLHKTPNIFPSTKVIQVTSNSLTWLLTPGRHVIIIPEILVKAKSWCGIVSFTGKVDNAKSTGLKWNLDNIAMEFGGLISTSNTYADNCIEVTLSIHDRIIWTMGMEPLFGTEHDF